MSSGETVFVSWPGYAPDGEETGARLAAAGHAMHLAPKLGARSAAELDRLLGGASAAIVSTDPFTADVLAAHPKLRIIARIGVGTDSIDRAAAAAAGVAIAITPGLNAETVADHTLALILALVRKVVPQDGAVKAGRWERFGDFLPGELFGRTVGLVGGGTIGRAVARRLAGFSVRILFFDPVVDRMEGAEKVDTLDLLLAASDVLSLHAPLTADTRAMIGVRALERIRPGALLVNTARGPLVDEGAVYAALRERRLGGAALDVFGEEPPDASQLETVPNLVCAAHMGGLSDASIRRMTISATDSVLAVLGGAIPDTVINPDAVRGR